MGKALDFEQGRAAEDDSGCSHRVPAARRGFSAGGDTANRRMYSPLQGKIIPLDRRSFFRAALAVCTDPDMYWWRRLILRWPAMPRRPGLDRTLSPFFLQFFVCCRRRGAHIMYGGRRFWPRGRTNRTAWRDVAMIVEGGAHCVCSPARARACADISLAAYDPFGPQSNGDRTFISSGWARRRYFDPMGRALWRVAACPWIFSHMTHEPCMRAF